MVLLAADADRLRTQDVLAWDRLVIHLGELVVAAALSRLDSVVPVAHSPAGCSSTMAAARHSCSYGPYLASKGALASYC